MSNESQEPRTQSQQSMEDMVLKSMDMLISATKDYANICQAQKELLQKINPFELKAIRNSSTRYSEKERQLSDVLRDLESITSLKVI